MRAILCLYGHKRKVCLELNISIHWVPLGGTRSTQGSVHKFHNVSVCQTTTNSSNAVVDIHNKVVDIPAPQSNCLHFHAAVGKI